MRLRGRQIAGARFRRQEPIASYVVDFCCVERKLIIEVDGSWHAARKQMDQRRTEFLGRLGYRVLRFWDHEVLGGMDAVLARVEEIVTSPHPGPLPEGEGTHFRNASDSSRGSVIIASHSEDETRTFGARLARYLRGGELIGLVGELGAGKTCLVRGLAEALGIAPRKVRSPTFTLVNEYSGGRLPLYHIDLYRLAPSPVDRMALRDYLCGDGVCVVEWFEHLREQWPHLQIQLTFVGANERVVVAQAHGAQYDALLDALAEG